MFQCFSISSAHGVKEKQKNIPKPPPLHTYMHAPPALVCSLCFIQKWKHPKMLSPS